MSTKSSYTISEIERMAEAVAKSKLFGVTDTNQVLTLMLLSQAEGIHPMLAARDYHIINGTPALKADAILSRFQSAGGIVEWTHYEDDKCSAKFSINKSIPVEVVWDVARAQKAGLTRNAMWVKFPRQMLKARVISEGVKITAPSVCSGLYTPEEVITFTSPQEQEVDTYLQILLELQMASSTEEIDQIRAKCVGKKFTAAQTEALRAAKSEAEIRIKTVNINSTITP